MIYTDSTRKALKLCYKAHNGQTDKSGTPYVFHPFHLAEQMKTEDTVIVALLHDVIEDTTYTIDDIAAMGFSDAVLKALSLMTHDPDTPYDEYIRAIATNPIAMEVKIADLRHNMDVTRLSENQKALFKTQSRLQKYQTALTYLTEEAGKIAAYKKAHEQILINRMSYQNSIRGCLIGGAIGDALGYPVEFLSWDEICRRYGNSGITKFSLKNGIAQISDDTQMSLFTACGLLYGITRSKLRGIGAGLSGYIYPAYLAWLKTQGDAFQDNLYDPHPSWVGNIAAMYSSRAPGCTCLEALQSGIMGTIEKPLNNSKGCGGIMRIAPIAAYVGFLQSSDKYAFHMQEAAEAAAITHGHPLGWLTAAALAYILNRIIKKPNREPLKNIITECRDAIGRCFGKYNVQDDMEKMFHLWTFAEELAANSEPDTVNIERIGGGWVAEETLGIALYCCLRYPDDFDKAIIAAANHSGDSDSTASVVGNIMGARLGYGAISDRWKENLELKDIILTVADDLCDDCQMSDYGSYKDDVWMHKYVYCDYPKA